MEKNLEQGSDSRALKSRYRRILRFASLALAQAWWFELFLPQIGLTTLSKRGRIKRYQKLARKFHTLAIDLGGLMIKVGQFMSSRLDILPSEITKELEGLQDEVAPVSFDQIVAQLQNELGQDLDSAYAVFETEPIAAASLGQAYRAKLSQSLAGQYGFENVVVKVLRPGIEKVVEVDLRALRKIGGWLSRVKLVARRTDAPRLVEEFAQTTLQEIDYLNEAKNLERFEKNFAADPRVKTPEIVWDRTSHRTLTLSDVSAIKITDIDNLVAAGLDPNAVAAELARITFEQFFVHGFFHADPHPGNIFVNKEDDVDGVSFSLTFIDFGMMGEISDELRENLQRFIFAVVARDARAWVTSMERLGVLLPSADTVLLEQAVAELFDRFGGVAVGEIANTDPREFRDFAVRFSELVRTLPFQLPENFLLLIRSISVISGVASALNREFNMWDAVDPFARSLISGGGNSTLKTLGKEISIFSSTMLRLPQRLDAVASRIERGELVVRNPELERQVQRTDASIRRVTSALVFIALFGGGIALRVNSDELGNWLLFASVIPLLHAIGFGRLR